MRPYIKKYNPLLLTLILFMALALMFCEPGQSLDPVIPKDVSLIAKIEVVTAPSQLKPTDTGLVQVSISDSTGGLPLKGAKLEVASGKFSILSATSASAFTLDSVPDDGKVTFRIFSSTSGTGTVVVKATSGSLSRSLSISVAVTEKPVAPKIVVVLPQKLLPKDTAKVTVQVLDSAEEDPLSYAVVTFTSAFFTLLDPTVADTLSQDTTGADGKISFRITSPVASPAGSIQIKVKTAAGITRTATATMPVSDEGGIDRPRKMVFTALRSLLRADGTDSSELVVLVKDDNNNPLAGEKIRFTSTGGVVKAQALTDSWGKATSILVSERANRSVVVTATLEKTGATAQQTVAFDGVTIIISPGKRVLMRDSTDPLVFELRDGGNVPMSGDSLEIVLKGTSKGFGTTGKDSLIVITDTRGQFKTFLTSATAGDVIITARALGTNSQDTVTFSNNRLSLTALGKSFIVGDGIDKVALKASLNDGSGNAMNGKELRWTTTFGTFSTSPFTLTSGGESSIELKSPKGSGLAIVNVEAYEKNGDGSRSLLASGNITVPVKALKVHRLELKVTPDNIPVKVGEARLIAQAFDSTNNVMTGVLIAFRLVKGAGGGDEIITPPVDYTKAGTAEATIKAGGVISLYRGVKLAAVALDISGTDTLVIASSDTVGLTISGPPHKVSVGVNILKGENIDDGTFALPTAAVVTDVNGNLVADGTPVNFSVLAVSAIYYGESWHPINDWPYYALGDTVAYFLPWTDYNNNKKLDPDEEPSAFDLSRTRPARGEDKDGNGYINFPLDEFFDLNHNGIWDSVNAEPTVQAPPTDTTGRRIFVDFNRDGIQQSAEPFIDYNNDGKCQCAGTRDFKGDLYEATYFGSTSTRPFPGDVAVGINRVTETGGGKATTRIVYVQSQATLVRVRITAEANGYRSFVDATLPIVQSGGGN